MHDDKHFLYVERPNTARVKDRSYAPLQWFAFASAAAVCIVVISYVFTAEEASPIVYDGLSAQPMATLSSTSLRQSQADE